MCGVHVQIMKQANCGKYPNQNGNQSIINTALLTEIDGFGL